ncbi:RodZ domain-containing protein [Rodentibacter haemolyticus]|uniref:RodZ domain-containing protein n=1 Tax=Rodentibacter haemolyticus TaxID=2778911 RepID=UPI0038CD4B3F
MNMPVEPIEVQSDREMTLGEKFRQARESLNLSLEDVSKQIALRPAILAQIENNEFIQKNVPATFMKGYVRNYGKFLRLPESLWADLSVGETEKNDLGKNARVRRSANQYSSHGRWVGYLTALVLLVALSMTGLWWWQNYQKSNEERDTLVQNYVSDTEANKEKSENLSAQSVEISVPQSAQTAESSINIPTAEVSTNTEIKVEKAARTPLVQSENPLPKSMTFKESERESNANEEVVSDTQSAVENPSISLAPPTAQGDLVVEILKNTSWLSVKDKNRKVLAQKEYKQGEVLTFNGDEFSLIVGAPGNVRITYKGENYPLKIDGRIAKFKLSQP